MSDPPDWASGASDNVASGPAPGEFTSQDIDEGMNMYMKGLRILNGIMGCLYVFVGTVGQFNCH